MNGIFETNDSFDFSKLVLTKPIMISGGNYFIRCLVDNSPLYIQPPKCTTKQGILKAGKRYYTDLMFTNENEDFIRWMENLENHCQQYIFKNREKWFDGEMELHDVENYFTSPLKLYKSGKFYIARSNLNVVLNKPTLKIYDENEMEINMDSINDKTCVITILEIQGIKCSARSFQIELEIKQMMVLKQNNLFEKCIIATSKKNVGNNAGDAVTNGMLITEVASGHNEVASGHNEVASGHNETLNGEDDVIIKMREDSTNILNESTDLVIETDVGTDTNGIDANGIDTNTIEESHLGIEESNTIVIENENENENKKKDDGLEEVTFNLEELSANDTMQLKKRNDVYYEMYREARRKAKMAKDLALSSYLEAKRIKNTYMLEDIDDSDDSDLEIDDDEDS
jgi:hypothetical protein